MTYGVGYPDPGLGQACKCGGQTGKSDTNPLKRISNGNKDIFKHKNLHRFASTQKDQIKHFHKMNDAIKIDSTIAGSVNVTDF